MHVNWGCPLPSLSATVTTVATVETALSPQLKKKLVVKVAEHERLTQEIAALEEERAAVKAAVQKAFIDAKATTALMNGVKINGVPVKMVCGSHSTTDKEAIRNRLIELGEDDVRWIENNAVTTKPSTPYIKIGSGSKKERE